jgi:CheY-like chemotaxis protein
MSASKITVLVVDDRPDVRLSLLYMLEASGYDVCEAGDGREAIAVIAKRKVDVVLTDLFMPVMGGLELLGAIRNRPGPHPRVIAMTGSGSIENPVVRSAIEQLGPGGVLQKPFTREHLIKAIGNADRR